MSNDPQSTMSSTTDQAERRKVLRMGIASLFCWVLGPIALVHGLKVHRKSPDGSSKATIFMGGIATIILALSVVTLGLYFTNNSGKAQDEKLTVPFLSNLGKTISARKPHQVTERVKLTPDQSQFVTAYGWPDNFVINLEPDGKRIEIWQYFACHSDDVLLQTHFRPCRISFVNGKFRNVQTFESKPRQAQLSYRPTEFIASLTQDQIRQEYGKPNISRDPDIEGLGKIDVLQYHKEIVFMFREGKLWGIVTIPEEAGS